MSYSLPSLPYGYNALEPHIDARTMEIHHTKHHQGYVDKLNVALEGLTDLQRLSVEDLLRDVDKVPADKRQAVVNNGGGHANHSLFWAVMSPDGGGEPTGELATMIAKDFGTFAEFKEAFTEKATTLFGSGWVFLVVSDGKLVLKRHSFQNNPLLHGQTPILGLDVWEHAYYLKYQNRRAEYITAWWEIVNWDQVGKNYLAAIS